MKLIILAIIIVIPFIGFNQYTWEQQTSGATNSLRAIRFLDNNFGFCTGETGEILKTTDGGENWTTMTTLPQIGGVWTTNLLLGVEILNPSTIVTFANGGQVYKSTDGGSNWNMTYDLGTYLSQSTFVDNRLFVCGSYMYYSDDFGDTWDSITVPAMGGTIGDASYFPGSSIGFAVGSTGGVAKTLDFGLTWTAVSGIPTAEDLTNVSTLSPNDVVIAGDNGVVITSSNAGGSWSTSSSSVTDYISAMDFETSLIGYAGTNTGDLIETTNGGASWVINTNHSITGGIWGIDMKTDSVGFLCEDLANEIHRSPTGGAIADIRMIGYVGPDTICAGVPFDFEFQFENLGPGYALYPEFLILVNTNSLTGANEFYTDTVFSGETVTMIVQNVTLTTLGNLPITLLAVDGFASAGNNPALGYTIEVVDVDITTVSGPHVFCPDESFDIEATGGQSYVWTGGVVDFPNVAAPSSSPLVATEYYVEIVQDYCSVFDTVYATVGPFCDTATIDSIIPKPLVSYAFTPNDDGVNDVLVLDFLEGTTNTVTIFNRWGDELYTITDYNNEDVVWDGEYNTVSAPVGTYFFIVEYSNNQTAKGWIQLLR